MNIGVQPLKNMYLIKLYEQEAKFNVTMWRKSTEEAEALLREICDWSQLSCKMHRFDFSVTEEKAKRKYSKANTEDERANKKKQTNKQTSKWTDR